MRPVQPSVVAVQRQVMLSAMPSSGIVNSVIRITGIGDHDRPEWLIRISGIRTSKKWAPRSTVRGEGWGPITSSPWRMARSRWFRSPPTSRFCCRQWWLLHDGGIAG